MNLNLPHTPLPYSLKAVADANGVHLSTVCRWVSRGVDGVFLKAYRVGGRRYVDRRALEEFDRRLNSPASMSPTDVYVDSVDEELDAAGL